MQFSLTYLAFQYFLDLTTRNGLSWPLHLTLLLVDKHTVYIDQTVVSYEARQLEQNVCDLLATVKAVTGALSRALALHSSFILLLVMHNLCTSHQAGSSEQ